MILAACKMLDIKDTKYHLKKKMVFKNLKLILTGKWLYPLIFFCFYSILESGAQLVGEIAIILVLKTCGL